MKKKIVVVSASIAILLVIIWLVLITICELYTIHELQAISEALSAETSTSHITEKQYSDGQSTSIHELQAISGVLSAETSTYRITEKQYSYGQTTISYPNVEVFGNTQLSTEINKKIQKFLFVGFRESEIESHEGVLWIESTYSITFSDDEILSVYAHVNTAEGMSKGAEYSTGFVYSIHDACELSLNSLNITVAELQRKAKDNSVYISPVLMMLYNDDSEQYSPYELLGVIDTQTYNMFVLGQNSIYVIAEPTGREVREHNGLIQIFLDWQKYYN